VFVFSLSALHSTPELTLDDLRKLEITCFVPSYLPKDFHLQRIDITSDEPGPNEAKHQFPIYSIVYSNRQRSESTSSIESAREGIGDRNLMSDEENSEETEIRSPLGAMNLIYRPKGESGPKDEIIANWVSDTNMNDEARNPDNHPFLGRYHGISATGITLAEFVKIVQSLHPVKDEKPATTPMAMQTSPLKIHPKVFSMINCWISDSESPVVTEINLDAVEKNRNEFNDDGLKQDGEWLQYIFSAGYERIHALPGPPVERQSQQGGVSGKRRRNPHDSFDHRVRCRKAEHSA
jgi:hypothetical protein